MSRSPSPSSRRQLPSRAFPDAMTIPYKSLISPPSTTFTLSADSTPSSDLSLSPLSQQSSPSSDLGTSPRAPTSSVSSVTSASCAYPDWPKRTILSPLSSFCGNQASSYISDEDLQDLEELDLDGNQRVPTYLNQEISWEATKQPPLVLHSLLPQQKARPTQQRRRRSSPLKKRKRVQGMSPILEGPE